MIEKGFNVFLPVSGLHIDEKYYEEPDIFKPERFFEKSSIVGPYYPFGDGPRNCIAMRFAKIQTKVGVLLMLSNYKYELKSKHDLEIDPGTFIMAPKDPVKLSIMKREIVNL